MQRINWEPRRYRSLALVDGQQWSRNYWPLAQTPNLALLSGETPLMTAVDNGNLEAVRDLLERGAKVEVRETNGGQTALMWAIADQQPQIAKLLVEHGADVHARSKGGFTPLLFAAQQGDVQSAGILLNAGADKNEFDTKDHMSAVMVAASMDHPEVAALLLDKGADPNLLDVRGYTALHFAASSANRLEIVKALLAHDAKPNVRTTRNLPGAGFGGISFKGATPLFVAASVGNIQAVRALVSAGADPQIPTDLKTTPVAAAAGLGSPQSARDYTDEEKNNLFETTKFLVSLGADVNAAGEHGWTPLHGAAYKGIDQVVQFLMEHGANAKCLRRVWPDTAQHRQRDYHGRFKGPLRSKRTHVPSEYALPAIEDGLPASGAIRTSDCRHLQSREQSRKVKGEADVDLDMAEAAASLAQRRP